MEKKQRPFLRWQELVLLLVLVCGLLWWKYQRPAGATAQLYIGNQAVMALKLDSTVRRIDLAEEYGVPVSLEISGGKLRFVDVDCPDHLCEKTGWISQEGESVVCLPNRVAAVIAQSGPAGTGVAGSLPPLAASTPHWGGERPGR
ncbi:NusG domain II-containing protein [Oscillospiraceae bacterium MB08-C2-2]|nr:NusG domain II-containing protein [Oscillospiraceae bacterium MB08-C2-2]